MVCRGLGGGGEMGAGGIGEQDVELALFALDLSEEAIEIGEVRDVSLYAGDSCADLLHRRGQLCLAASGDEDVSAFGHKAFCGGQTDAGAAAGDECDFSLEFIHVFLFSQACQIVRTTLPNGRPSTTYPKASAASPTGQVLPTLRLIARDLWRPT